MPANDLPEAPPQARPDKQRIVGLDSIRAVLASWVVYGHFGRGLPPDVMSEGPLRYLRLLINNAVFSGSAVVGFFVVSGFCIHYPNRQARSIDLLPFYVRREVRILVPLGLMLALSRFVGVTMPVFRASILWSLICEEIYYLLYPAILVAIRKVGAVRLLIASFIAAYSVIIIVPNHDGTYPAYGASLNWVVGLPCWLLGCLLAQNIQDSRFALTSISSKRLWTMRTVTFMGSLVCSILRFHTSLAAPWTLDLFAVLCFFWLRTEILYYRRRSTPPLLERLGLGSYSIYLVHLHAWVLWSRMGAPDWFVPRFLFVFAFAYAFYRLVESPSHRLARTSYLWLKRRSLTGDLAERAPAP